MNLKEIFEYVDEDGLTHLTQMKDIVLQLDSKVEGKIDGIMSVEMAIVFEQEGVFKYGLAPNKKHISFHSMVMYANPDLKTFIEHKKLNKIKVLKGCINFSSPQDFPLTVFREFIRLSAAIDFSPVINHYKNKK